MLNKNDVNDMLILLMLILLVLILLTLDNSTMVKILQINNVSDYFVTI